MVDRACRECRYISQELTCPNCKSTNLSDDFSGVVYIIDPERSAVAHLMGINKKGKYAIRVR